MRRSKKDMMEDWRRYDEDLDDADIEHLNRLMLALVDTQLQSLGPLGAWAERPLKKKILTVTNVVR